MASFLKGFGRSFAKGVPDIADTLVQGINRNANDANRTCNVLTAHELNLVLKKCR